VRGSVVVGAGRVADCVIVTRRIACSKIVLSFNFEQKVYFRRLTDKQNKNDNDEGDHDDDDGVGVRDDNEKVI
jgi:hypothetical protein